MTRNDIFVACLLLGTIAIAYSGNHSIAVDSKAQVPHFVGKIIDINWHVNDGMWIMTPCHVHDCDAVTGMLCLSSFRSDAKERRIWVHPSAFNHIEVITEQKAKETIERQDKWDAEQNARVLKKD